ncbi:MAG: ceramidase domain-containing protein [Desulfobacterales bacterium]
MNNQLTINEKVGFWLIALMTLVAAIALVIHGSIPQSPRYHAFGDKRTLWGIPHFFDVISNLPFVLVGLLGLYESFVSDTIKMVPENRVSYHFFFIGVALVGVGSGYYHLAPSNESLVWDRIPMTIAIMALVSIVIGEFVSMRLGAILLIPLVAIGILSVLYWYWTETAGNGDLRPYVLVQFLPMIVMPVILVCFNSAYTKTSGYWFLLSAYVIAKICEHFDSVIFVASDSVSGHTLKHLAAATGIYLLLLSFRRRRIA